MVIQDTIQKQRLDVGNHTPLGRMFGVLEHAEN